jgi:ligand-binding sensor domain-containing protein
VNGLVVDPSLANTLYAATDIGVFVTTDGGTSWSALGTGLPRVVVMGLTLDNQSRTLAAATHGRSAWYFSLPPGLPGTRKRSVRVTSD